MIDVQTVPSKDDRGHVLSDFISAIRLNADSNRLVEVLSFKVINIPFYLSLLCNYEDVSHGAGFVA